ncbi:MAG TPA: pitrilysin family protein [Phycisphaerales bacterium]|nr:pitrilysin family protein [Phycisphaerales bacterium]
MAGIFTTTLSNGLTVILEEIPGVSSAALHWAVPCGSATDDADRQGASAMMAEMLLRGAGRLSSREHSDAMDRLGVQRSTGVRVHHLCIDATLMGGMLHESLSLIMDMVRAPMMQAEALEPVRSLCLQGLEGLDDDPQQRAMLRVRERHIAPPFNRHGFGTADGLQSVTIQMLTESWARFGTPAGSIFAIAGALNARDTLKILENLAHGWQGHAQEPRKTALPESGYEHMAQSTAQVHLAMAWDAPREAHAHSMLERLAVSVLSGSTSGRLFTEVRQRRSLCYSVGASYRAGRDAGVVSLYAGTTPERAQETLDVCVQEVIRMKQGVTLAEFQRAVTGLKSHVVMQGESTMARAAALSHDFFRIGRARSLEEICAQVDAISHDQLNDYLRTRETPKFSIVSIGPDPMNVPGA